jgi:hypothetical protein
MQWLITGLDRMIFMWISGKCGLDAWIGFIWDVVSCCKLGSEPLGFINRQGMS